MERFYSGCRDMYGNKIYTGDVIQSTTFGSRLRVVLNKEDNLFEGQFEPHGRREFGYVVRNIGVLDLNDYFKVEDE